MEVKCRYNEAQRKGEERDGSAQVQCWTCVKRTGALLKCVRMWVYKKYVKARGGRGVACEGIIAGKGRR